jgi:hypothetical protein
LTDPLATWFGTTPWEPWDAAAAAERFLRVLGSLSDRRIAGQGSG